MSEQVEKRKYPRVFFAPENRLSAVFEQPGLTAVVLDMSRGGMGVSVKRAGDIKFEENDRVSLSGISDRDGLEISAGFQIEIRWVVDQPGFEHIAFGCRFLDPPQSFVEAISTLLDRSLIENAG